MCGLYIVCFFFKQKTAYEMRISDWSSDVCSSDLHGQQIVDVARRGVADGEVAIARARRFADAREQFEEEGMRQRQRAALHMRGDDDDRAFGADRRGGHMVAERIIMLARERPDLLLGVKADQRMVVERARYGRDRHAGHPCQIRSEEHTSELQSLMRISYAVFCLKKKNI